MDNYAALSQAEMNTGKPTQRQAEVGNYRKGRVTLHDLKIAIENPRGGIREGVDASGRPWRNVMKAAYGHFERFIGADGDGVDVFIGEYPETQTVWIINQRNSDNSFDEHKVMLGFLDKRSAIFAYNKSYDDGWRGLQSIVQCTVEQLRWWLKHGNKTRPVTKQSFPYDAGDTMNEESFDKLVSEDSAAGLLLDSATVSDILEDADTILALDALVLPYNKIERKMTQLMGIMKVVAGDVKPVAVQITDPFRQKGTTNIAAVFELSDGQTVSIFFHNPDVTPNKITPTDDLISWKWLLNKKDVTILVAPEKGLDLNPREVGRRIMKLAEKNSARFMRANEGKVARMAEIESLKGQVEEKQATLAALNEEIASLEAKKESGVSKGGIPDGWEESDYGGMLINTTDKIYGGIIDDQPATGKWFVIPNNKQLNEQFSGVLFDSRDQAFSALNAAASELQISAEERSSDSDAKAFIQSVIDGTADLYDKGAFDKLAAYSEAYAGNAEMGDLLAKAKTAAKAFFMAEFQKKTA